MHNQQFKQFIALAGALEVLYRMAFTHGGDTVEIAFKHCI